MAATSESAAHLPPAQQAADHGGEDDGAEATTFDDDVLAVGLHEYCQRRTAVARWWQWARGRRRCRSQAAAFTHRHARAVLCMTWNAWMGAVAKRRALIRLTRAWALARTRKAWRTWLAMVDASTARRHGAMTLAGWWARCRMHAGLAAWWARAHTAKQREACIARMTTALRRAAVRLALRRWQRRMEAAQRAETVARFRQRQATSAAAGARHCRRAIRAWRRVTAHEQHVQQFVVAHAAARRMDAMSHVFRSWKAYVRRCQHARAMSYVAAAHRDCARLRTAFQAFVAGCAASAEESRRQEQARNMVQAWRRYAQVRVGRRDAMDTVVAVCRVHAMRHVMAAWQRSCRQVQRQRYHMLVAAVRRRAALMRRVFGAWVAYTDAARQQGEVTLAAVAWYNSKLLARCMAAWKTYHAGKVVDRAARAVADRHRLGVVWRWWQGVRPRLAAQRTAERALRNTCRRHVVRMVLGAWLQASLARGRRRQAWVAVQRRRQVAWLHTWHARAMDTERERVGNMRASAWRRAVVCRKALHGWRAVTMSLSRTHGPATAVVAAVQGRVVQRAWHAWRLATCAVNARMVQMEGGAAYHAAQMRVRVVQACLHAWSADAQRRTLLRTLQRMASAGCARRQQSHAVAAWRHWAHERRALADMRHRADGWLAGHTVATAWRGWRVMHRRVQARLEQEASALTHWALGLQRRAFRAWVAWCRWRRGMASIVLGPRHASRIGYPGSAWRGGGSGSTLLPVLPSVPATVQTRLVGMEWVAQGSGVGHGRGAWVLPPATLVPPCTSPAPTPWDDILHALDAACEAGHAAAHRVTRQLQVSSPSTLPLTPLPAEAPPSPADAALPARGAAVDALQPAVPRQRERPRAWPAPVPASEVGEVGVEVAGAPPAPLPPQRLGPGSTIARLPLPRGLECGQVHHVAPAVPMCGVGEPMTRGTPGAVVDRLIQAAQAVQVAQAAVAEARQLAQAMEEVASIRVGNRSASLVGGDGMPDMDADVAALVHAAQHRLTAAQALERDATAQLRALRAVLSPATGPG